MQRQLMVTAYCIEWIEQSEQSSFSAKEDEDAKETISNELNDKIHSVQIVKLK